MLIGVPKEIKNHEYRVGLVPSSVRELTHHGHEVWVQTGAGEGSGFTDADYTSVGAKIIGSAPEIFQRAEMIVKVKEPQMSECAMLRPGQILFTYLHLVTIPDETKALVKSECVAIAYETVTSPKGGLPLLTPMSEVAGRLSIQAGAHCLEKKKGGAGVLLGGVPGVRSGKVVVIGGGAVGSNAARMAAGLGANVTILDKSLHRLAELDERYGDRMKTLYANMDNVEQAVTSADLVVGAVLVPGAMAPKLVTRAMVKKMRPGSVLVDVAIDQGGCFETSRPTTHDEPTFVEDGVIHYCVTNMPGSVARTSSQALNNATLPFVMDIAHKGYARAMLDNPHLLEGLNIYHGHITYEAVARDLGYAFNPVQNLLYKEVA